MLSDLRYVLRALVRNRGFTAVVVLTLALGIGSAAAIFSVTDWILFRANQFPENLCFIGGQMPEGRFNAIRTDVHVRAFREQGTRVLSRLALASYRNGNVVWQGEPIGTARLAVSANLFELLGIKPELGRTFGEGEDRPGSDQVIVISHQFWQRKLNGRKDVIGLHLTVDQTVCTIVGVLRVGQAMPGYFYNDVYQPLVYRADPAQPWEPPLFVLGELRPGVSREQATELLRGLKLDFPTQFRPFFEREQVALASLPELDNQSRWQIYWVILGAVGFLYAIACLNASNLMLVRMLGRRRELSIRLALGGGRMGIIRLLALESGLLAILAGLTGLLMANWLFPVLLSAAGNTFFAQRDWTSWSLGWRVLGVAAGLTLLTSLLIVILPAWRVLRTDISSGLKEGGLVLGEVPALARLRGSLVVLQAAFALVLLAGAGLMIRTFQQFQKVDLGFDPSGLAKVLVAFPPNYSPGNEARLVRLREIEAELRRVPGVRSVGFGSDILLPGYYFDGQKFLRADGTAVRSAMVTFGEGYQDVSGLKLKRGHWLPRQTNSEVLVNETMARAMWPGQEPIGQFLKSSDVGATGDWKGWQVAGVVADVRGSMRETAKNYIFGAESRGGMGMDTFLVRFAGEYNEQAAGRLRQRLYAFDPKLVVHRIMSIDQVRDMQLWSERMADSVLKVLAGIALLLTVVGVFSVLAYTVDQRMSEFGVRMALGATSRDLVSLVMTRGVALSLAGIVLGLGGTLVLTRYLKTLLFETPEHDPLVLAVVAGVLLVTAVLACVLPARRAARVDVSKLLRSE